MLPDILSSVGTLVQIKRPAVSATYVAIASTMLAIRPSIRVQVVRSFGVGGRDSIHVKRLR